MNLLRSILVLVALLLSSQTTLNAQQFDEQFDLWPVKLKINGTVIAGGGGQLPSDAFDIFLAAARKQDANPVLVRLADSNAESEDEFFDEFISLDSQVVIEILNGKPGLTDESMNTIKNSKALWISSDQDPGKHQIGNWKKIINAAKSAVENGATVCVNGSCSEYLGKLNSDTTTGNLTGAMSNLVPDSVIQESYNDESQRGQLLSILADNPRCVGIGIDQDTAIVLRGRKIRVVGEGSATFCLMANQQNPLRVQHVKQAKTRMDSPYDTIVDLTAWRRDAIERTVASFPEKNPPKPIVEKGTLMIVGGGGMPSGLMDQMVELAGGKDARMVYVPCSENDEVSGRQGIVEKWKKMGVQSATFVHTKDRSKANSDQEFLAPLKNATGIWFGGGRQWNFSDSYYGTAAHKLMKQVLQRGGVIGGSSAGASIQARYMCRANPVANFDIMAPGYERGLGFIGGVAIDQHFSQRGRQKDMTLLVNRYPQLLGIGLDEGTAIIVNRSQAKVVGRGKVHFYDRNQPVIPGADDFLALGSGAVFDLVERKIVE